MYMSLQITQFKIVIDVLLQVKYQKKNRRINFFLQAEFHQILEHSTLISYDIKNILVKLYGFNEIDVVEDKFVEEAIDLIENIEK